MSHSKLQKMLFLSLCCSLGMFSKRLIGPIANIITDSLHIPGGIGTSFSLMFLVIAVALVPKFGNGTTMGLVQSALALSLGMVGSMGILSPIGYIVPGFIIDCVFQFTAYIHLRERDRMVIANALAAISASLTANIIVFRLPWPPLLLYLSVAGSSGMFCGMMGHAIVTRLRSALPIARRTGDDINET